MRRALLFALALGLTGCGAASVAGTVSAIESTFEVIRGARGLICTTKLDAIFGNPRAGQPTYREVPAVEADAGADDGGAP